jgi:hypothetical protein
MPDYTPDIYKNRFDFYPCRKDMDQALEIISRLGKDFPPIARTINESIGHRQVKR